MLSSSPELVLPVIRGIQAGREYYVAMCPVRLIPKLFSLHNENTQAEMRAQRSLNRVRANKIAEYILRNPANYTFSAITASIDAQITFEPLGTDAEAQKVGRLRIPTDAKFTINDGQHRLAAFELALKEKPELGYETITVIFFVDIGVRRSQQVFTDLNRYSCRPSPSLSLLYDHRDPYAILTRAVIKRVKVFQALTDNEHSTAPVHSDKLFTFSSIYHANINFLTDHKNVKLEPQIDLAASYWNVVSSQISDWEQVRQYQVSASEIRQNYVHSHAIALAGLGAAGAVLVSVYPDNWIAHLQGLKNIDWLRSNPHWEGKIISDGRIYKSKTSISYLTAYIKSHLNLPLTSGEKCLFYNSH